MIAAPVVKMYGCGLALALLIAGAFAGETPDAAKIVRHSHPIHDPAVDRYLTRLGRELAAQFPGAKPVFTITVVAEDPCPATHEPLGLPGGTIIVPAALFKAVEDEAEFAAMLAHAMEHRAARNDELRADALAIALAASAGFDPGALARYIARVQPPSSLGFERLRAMQPLVARLPPGGSQVSSSEFMAIQRAVNAIAQPTQTPKARPDR